MTLFLASVASVEEAQTVLKAGADIIDLKNPLQGTLGALPLETICKIVQAVGGQRPTSATVGDLLMEPVLIGKAVQRMARLEVDFVKVGLFGRYGRRECIEELTPLCAMGAKVAIVMFADQHPDIELLPVLKRCGCTAVMLDTAGKQSGRLTGHMSHRQLAEFVLRARERGLMCGLAGSLQREDIPSLLELQPDYLGFRGALCERANRREVLQREAVQTIRQMIPRSPSEKFSWQLGETA